MAVLPDNDETTALVDLRRRGQFLISGLLWAAALGFVIVLSGWIVVIYHYGLSVAERLRASLGFAAPHQGPDWFMVLALVSMPCLSLLCLAALWLWYRRIWFRKLAAIWPNRRMRSRYGGWKPLPVQATTADREERVRYISALLTSPTWASSRPEEGTDYEATSASVLEEMEKGIAERALTTGLTVGISRNRWVDLFTIFAAALELQLYVLSRLGKRPSWQTWRILVQRCGASLFINSYLNRQDSLALSLMIKKAGMGLYAAGDLMEGAATHLSESDIDLDEALNVQHAGLFGMATKSLELGATMALTVGQVGLHILGNLIESVGDELTQGALAAGIIYFHGISLAADTLALDQIHRASPEMKRNVRSGIWKMGEIAGAILRDVVRQRRTAFRDKRRQIVRSLPKTAYAGIQSLFGRKSEAS